MAYKGSKFGWGETECGFLVVESEIDSVFVKLVVLELENFDVLYGGVWAEDILGFVVFENEFLEKMLSEEFLGCLVDLGVEREVFDLEDLDQALLEGLF